MSFTYYNLYCDESGTDGGPPFYFGAIYCSPVRARILEAALVEVREQHGLTREMKWGRVSQAMLHRYKAFLDVFLNDPYSSFRLTEVSRGPQWRDFGRDEESRFFKAYYVFLRMNISLYSRYNIYVDDKSGKRYRWSNVQYAINGATCRDHGLTKKQVLGLVPLNSKWSNLLQVVDVVLGAAVSSATAPAKAELARYVRERLGQPRFLGNPKLVRRTWSPQLTASRA